jgi:hypothetical protein
MMQRASHGVSNNEAFRELSVVVRAACANRQELITSAHQYDVFAPCLTSDDRSVVKIANVQTLCKVEFPSFFCFCHNHVTTAQ